MAAPTLLYFLLYDTFYAKSILLLSTRHVTVAGFFMRRRHMKKFAYSQKQLFQLLEQGKITIVDIPYRVRIKNAGYYTTALQRHLVSPMGECPLTVLSLDLSVDADRLESIGNVDAFYECFPMLILDGIIRIDCLPFELRTRWSSYYIYALRRSRNRPDETCPLELLHEDISRLEPGRVRSWLEIMEKDTIHLWRKLYVRDVEVVAVPSE